MAPLLVLFSRQGEKSTIKTKRANTARPYGRLVFLQNGSSGRRPLRVICNPLSSSTASRSPFSAGEGKRERRPLRVVGAPKRGRSMCPTKRVVGAPTPTGGRYPRRGHSTCPPKTAHAAQQQKRQTQQYIFVQFAQKR